MTFHYKLLLQVNEHAPLANKLWNYAFQFLPCFVFARWAQSRMNLWTIPQTKLQLSLFHKNDSKSALITHECYYGLLINQYYPKSAALLTLAACMLLIQTFH